MKVTPSAAPLVLIVEDETRLSALVADYLRAAGLRVEECADGALALERVERLQPDLMVLDLMLPGRDGLEICRAVRATSTLPIIMTTARIEEIDRLLGLELGADDYLCKPYSPRELVARVKAVLRRSLGRMEAHQSGEGAETGLLQLDRASLRVRVEGREVELTAVEFALLEVLHAAPGRIFSRERLMERIYPDQRIVSGRTIDSHVKKLRHKLASLLPGVELIHSVYGVGYRYEAPALSASEMSDAHGL